MCCAFINRRRGRPQHALELAFECALFVIGLAFGSFLNVCISRIPRDESVISPRSRCPACGAFLRWHDNIPLLSWLLLRRRCRDCGSRISLRYPIVELLTAVLFTACYGSFGSTLVTVKLCIFCFLLVGLIFMDAETGLLPREFTYTGNRRWGWRSPGLRQPTAREHSFCCVRTACSLWLVRISRYSIPRSALLSEPASSISLGRCITCFANVTEWDSETLR